MKGFLSWVCYSYAFLGITKKGDFMCGVLFVSYTEAMTMGKLHKEIGQLIVQSAEDPDKSDSQVIKVNILFLNLINFSC